METLKIKNSLISVRILFKRKCQRSRVCVCSAEFQAATSSIHYLLPSNFVLILTKSHFDQCWWNCRPAEPRRDPAWFTFHQTTSVICCLLQIHLESSQRDIGPESLCNNASMLTVWQMSTLYSRRSNKQHLGCAFLSQQVSALHTIQFCT